MKISAGPQDLPLVLTRTIGYTPNETDLTLAILDGKRLELTANIRDFMSTDIQLTAEVIQSKLRNLENPAIIYVGWGPTGDDNAMALVSEIAMDRPHMDHTALHVQGNHVRCQEVGVDEQWGNWLPLREPSMDIIMELGAPYTSRQTLQAAYEPYGQPTFRHLDVSTKDTYAKLSPSMRAEIADRFLDQLSGPNKFEAMSWQTNLAHLITQDTPVRDHVVVAGLKDPAKAEALLQLYRSAPPELQGPLGTIAATTLLGHDATKVGSGHIIDQLRGHPHGLGNCKNLHNLVDQLQINGLNPNPVVNQLKSLDQTAELETADAAWNRNQQTNAASSSYTPGRLPRLNDPVDLTRRATTPVTGPDKPGTGLSHSNTRKAT